VVGKGGVVVFEFVVGGFLACSDGFQQIAEDGLGKAYAAFSSRLGFSGEAGGGGVAPAGFFDVAFGP
jgi:hypothetical protein